MTRKNKGNNTPYLSYPIVSSCQNFVINKQIIPWLSMFWGGNFFENQQFKQYCNYSQTWKGTTTIQNQMFHTPHPPPPKRKGIICKVSFHKIVANLLYCHILKLYVSAIVLNRIGSMCWLQFWYNRFDFYKPSMMKHLHA